eukprot:6304766-Ditylum_brightwellii.AAC.1
MYHLVFVHNMLSDVKADGTILQGNCNVGVSTSKEKGAYRLWNFWLNEKGIANLLSIPQLEKDGYTIDYNTKRTGLSQCPQARVLCSSQTLGYVRECHT